jgi:hypothetical protein
MMKERFSLNLYLEALNHQSFLWLLILPIQESWIGQI